MGSGQSLINSSTNKLLHTARHTASRFTLLYVSHFTLLLHTSSLHCSHWLLLTITAPSQWTFSLFSPSQWTFSPLSPSHLPSGHSHSSHLPSEIFLPATSSPSHLHLHFQSKINTPNSIHSKSDNIGGVYFLLTKNCGKKVCKWQCQNFTTLGTLTFRMHAQ